MLLLEVKLMLRSLIWSREKLVLSFHPMRLVLGTENCDVRPAKSTRRPAL